MTKPPMHIELHYRIVIEVHRRDGEILSHGPGLGETDIDRLRSAFSGAAFEQGTHPVRLPIPLHTYGVGGLAIRLGNQNRMFVELLVEKGKTPEEVIHSAELALEGTPLRVCP